MREYQDFDLKIRRSTEDNKYFVSVPKSIAGEVKETEITLPFDDKDRKICRLEFKSIAYQVRNVKVGTRDEVTTEVEPLIEKFGEKLFEAVFQNAVGTSLRSSIDAAKSKEMRVRIRLRLSEDAYELAELPWEFLFNRARNHFLEKTGDVSLVRYLEQPGSIRPLKVGLPLRVLVMIPSRGGRIDSDKEWGDLRGAVSMLPSELISLDRVGEATHEGLRAKLSERARLREDGYHIFHYIGHGSFNKQLKKGFLYLDDEEDISGEELGTTLAYGGSLRLAVINACEGGETDSDNIYAGVAQSLIQHEIPAAVAMQFVISDQSAIKFASEFYQSIINGKPVEAAVSDARQAIRSQKGAARAEWGTPVLYTRAENGKLFDLPPGALNFEVDAEKIRGTKRPLSPPTGVLSSSSPFYVERAADKRCIELLAEPDQGQAAPKGKTISIWAGGQTGRSSFLKSLTEVAIGQHRKVAYLKFAEDFEDKHLADAKSFHQHFCRVLADKLGLPDRLGAYWKLHELSIAQRCTRYVNYLLQALQQSPILLVMDDVDRLAESGVRSSFFTMLRSWRNPQESRSYLEDVDIVWTSSIDASQLIEADTGSAFVGEVLSLEDFSVREAAELGKPYGINVSPERPGLKKLHDWTNGHPYLLQLAFHQIARGEIGGIDNLVKDLDDKSVPDDTGPFGRDLISKYTLLRRSPDLRDGLKKFLDLGKVKEDGDWVVIPISGKPSEEVVWKLHRSGLITREGSKAKVRCKLYEKYFRHHLTARSPKIEL